MKKGSIQAAIVLAAGLLASSSQPVQANATVYWDTWDGFTPSTVMISPGESVTWWNVEPGGFVQISVSGFLPFTLEYGEGAQATFSTAGTYNMSSDWGDHGSVIVNAPPSVTITNPVDNAVFTAPATVTVRARATDADGIYDVQFYMDDSISGSQLIDDDFTSPYSATTNLAEGTYTLTALATDNYGLQNSHSITITVTSAPAIGLGNPRLAGNQFLFDVTGLTVGKTNVVQYRTNLSAGAWISTATNVATATSRTVTNTAGVGPRFYQVFQRP